MSDVLKLVTIAERDTIAQAAHDDEVHREAVAMLEKALALAKERTLTGVAISFAWADGSYGRMTPTLMRNWAALVGSVATTQHDLIAKSLGPEAV